MNIPKEVNYFRLLVACYLLEKLLPKDKLKEYLSKSETDLCGFIMAELYKILLLNISIKRLIRILEGIHNLTNGDLEKTLLAITKLKESDLSDITQNSIINNLSIHILGLKIYVKQTSKYVLASFYKCVFMKE